MNSVDDEQHRINASLSIRILVEIPELNISYKPQKISPKFGGTVRDLLNSKIREAIFHPQFQTDVSRPLQIDNIIDQEVRSFFLLISI
jgi:translation initiation factor RLI1